MFTVGQCLLCVFAFTVRSFAWSRYKVQFVDTACPGHQLLHTSTDNAYHSGMMLPGIECTIVYWRQRRAACSYFANDMELWVALWLVSFNWALQRRNIFWKKWPFIWVLDTEHFELGNYMKTCRKCWRDKLRINMDISRTLGFKKKEDVKWDDVVSAGEGTKMVVWISGGCDSCLENAFMVFKNQDRN